MNMSRSHTKGSAGSTQQYRLPDVPGQQWASSQTPRTLSDSPNFPVSSYHVHRMVDTPPLEAVPSSARSNDVPSSRVGSTQQQPLSSHSGLHARDRPFDSPMTPYLEQSRLFMSNETVPVLSLNSLTWLINPFNGSHNLVVVVLVLDRPIHPTHAACSPRIC